MNLPLGWKLAGVFSLLMALVFLTLATVLPAWCPTGSPPALRSGLLLGFAGAVGVVVLFSLLLAGSFSRTMQQMVEALQQARAGKLQARVHAPATGEVERLREALNAALESLTQTLAQARQETQRYAALLQQMSDGVVVIDAEGRVQLVNGAFAETFGVEVGKAQERLLEEVSLNFELSMLCTRATEQGTVQKQEIRVLRPVARRLYAVVTPLKSSEGRTVGAVALLRDVTELGRMDQVRRDFVANASHELRSPAAGIRALAEVLESGALQDPEKGPDFVQQIVREADRLTRILDDMLTLTRVERGQELFHPRWVRMAEAGAEALANVSAAAMTKGVTLEQECGEEDQVYADPVALQTVLVNLLENAIKYTPGGGVVSLRGRVAPGGYELAVRDTGVGIAEEHLTRIFERFYRVDKARDRATGGTGLGLSIVRHTAEAHGGRVTVDSTPGEGSVFTVFFPMPAGEAAPPGGRAS